MKTYYTDEEIEAEEVNLNRKIVSPEGNVRYEKDQTTDQAIRVWKILVKGIHDKSLNKYRMYNEQNQIFFSYKNGITRYRAISGDK